MRLVWSRLLPVTRKMTISNLRICSGMELIWVSFAAGDSMSLFNHSSFSIFISCLRIELSSSHNCSLSVPLFLDWCPCLLLIWSFEVMITFHPHPPKSQPNQKAKIYASLNHILVSSLQWFQVLYNYNFY